MTPIRAWPARSPGRSPSAPSTWIAGRPAIQVEGADGLRPGDLAGHARIGVTGGTSTPIEDLELVARRIWELAGGPGDRERARELAAAAIGAVAESAYRTSSLPVDRRGALPAGGA